MDAVEAARGLGVPVYAVGFGGRAERNVSIGQIVLPAVVYSGETVAVQVRVAAAGFGTEEEPPRTPRAPSGQGAEKARIRLRGQEQEVPLGTGTSEQDVKFKLAFDRSGRQVVEARADSLVDESNYADNRRSVTVDVKPGRVRVAYVTNRPGPGTRMILRALEDDERIEVVRDVAVTGGVSLENWGQSLGAAASDSLRDSPRFPGHVPAVDVYLLDDVVETGSPEVWKAIADRVQAGAGALVLAGPDFQPGANISRLVNGTLGRAQTGTFTPELTAEGALLPWWGAARDFGESGTGSEAFDLGRVPPFAGQRGLGHDPNLRDSVMSRRTAWLVAQENKSPLVIAGKAGKGRVVYVAAYPLWRWGFGPDERPETGTPLSIFLSGVVRYLAERDTSPFRLQAEKEQLYHGQPVRLELRAVAPDGRPWTRLNVMLSVVQDTNPKLQTSSPTPPLGTRHSPLVAPMTENGDGVYQATLEALAPGSYRAVATIGTSDTVLGHAAAGFAVAEQSLELAATGLNEGLLEGIAQASGGRYYAADSLPRDGAEIALGSYQRRFTFDPRRAVWAYVLIALLAGVEWFLRRRRGLL